MQYKLGKSAAREGAIKLAFRDYVNHAALPYLPPVFGHVNPGIAWNVLGNDSVGDCVIAGAAHETMVFAHASYKPVPVFTADCVVKQYSQLTGYNPNDPNTDNGTDVQAAASWRKNTGIVDANGNAHKVKAYMALRAGNVRDVLEATYLFGACGVGIQIPQSAFDQFEDGRPWDVNHNSDNAGGHYVPVVGRNSRGNLICVTWGRLHAMTPAFLSAYMDEGVAYYSEEYLKADGRSPELFDDAQLNEALAAL